MLDFNKIIISYLFCRGICTLGKIFDLREGVAFLEKHKRNQAFSKAVKEMTLAMTNKMNEGVTCAPALKKIFDQYKQFLKN